MHPGTIHPYILVIHYGFECRFLSIANRLVTIVHTQRTGRVGKMEDEKKTKMVESIKMAWKVKKEKTKTIASSI